LRNSFWTIQYTALLWELREQACTCSPQSTGSAFLFSLFFSLLFWVLFGFENERDDGLGQYFYYNINNYLIYLVKLVSGSIFNGLNCSTKVCSRKEKAFWLGEGGGCVSKYSLGESPFKHLVKDPLPFSFLFSSFSSWILFFELMGCSNCVIALCICFVLFISFFI